MSTKEKKQYIIIYIYNRFFSLKRFAKWPQVAMFFCLSLPLVAADFATCGASDEWTAFRGQVLAPGPGVSPALAKRARRLVKRWKLPAQQWVTWPWFL
jgi:hypothetical protein